MVHQLTGPANNAQNIIAFILGIKFLYFCIILHDILLNFQYGRLFRINIKQRIILFILELILKFYFYLTEPLVIFLDELDDLITLGAI